MESAYLNFHGLETYLNIDDIYQKDFYNKRKVDAINIYLISLYLIKKDCLTLFDCNCILVRALFMTLQNFKFICLSK